MKHVLLLAILLSNALLALDVQSRPPMLQAKIEEAFQKISHHKASEWGVYNGAPSYFIGHVEEIKLLTGIIAQSPERTEFAVLDIGAGNFDFGQALCEKINASTQISADTVVDIVSLRGEQNLSQEFLRGEQDLNKEYQEKGKCRIYELGSFKIEDLESELQKRLKRLPDFDLIVSHWCFRHLADPVGTFQQALNRLGENGYFLVDGFFFTARNHQPIVPSQGSDSNTLENLMGWGTNFELLALMITSQAEILMMPYDDGRSLNHFIIHRPKGVRLQPLPVMYSGHVWGNVKGDIGSEVVTDFSWITSKPSFSFESYEKNWELAMEKGCSFYCGNSTLLMKLNEMDAFSLDYNMAAQKFEKRRVLAGPASPIS